MQQTLSFWNKKCACVISVYDSCSMNHAILIILLPETLFLHSFFAYSFNFESITFHNFNRVIFWRWFFCGWSFFGWVITTVIYLHSKWHFEPFFLTRKRGFWHSENFWHCRWWIFWTICRTFNFFAQTIFFLCLLEFFKILKKLCQPIRYRHRKKLTSGGGFDKISFGLSAFGVPPNVLKSQRLILKIEHLK